MQTIIDTLTALAGDSRIYTQEEKLTDHSYGLYYYKEVECKVCRKPAGVYMRNIIIGIEGSTFFACGRCLANNPGKFDDLM